MLGHLTSQIRAFVRKFVDGRPVRATPEADHGIAGNVALTTSGAGLVPLTFNEVNFGCSPSWSPGE